MALFKTESTHSCSISWALPFVYIYIIIDCSWDSDRTLWNSKAKSRRVYLLIPACFGLQKWLFFSEMCHHFDIDSIIVTASFPKLHQGWCLSSYRFKGSVGVKHDSFEWIQSQESRIYGVRAMFIYFTDNNQGHPWQQRSSRICELRTWDEISD